MFYGMARPPILSSWIIVATHCRLLQARSWLASLILGKFCLKTAIIDSTAKALGAMKLVLGDEMFALVSSITVPNFNFWNCAEDESVASKNGQNRSFFGVFCRKSINSYEVGPGRRNVCTDKIFNRTKGKLVKYFTAEASRQSKLTILWPNWDLNSAKGSILMEKFLLLNL